MARPFFIIGFVVFAFLNLIFANIKAAIILLFVAVAAFIICMCFKSTRQDFAIPTVAISMILALCLFMGCISKPISTEKLFDNKEAIVKLQLVESETKSQNGFINIAQTISINSKEYKAKVKIYSKHSLNAQPYDIAEGKFKLHSVGFKEDFERFNLSQNIILTAYLKGDVCIEKSENKPFYFRIINFKNTIKRSLDNNLSERERGLAKALLIGDKSEMSKEIKNDLTNIGVAHLTAVSGLHLSVWCLFALAVFKRIGVRGKLPYVISSVLVVLYMALTGFTPSVVRAGFMSLVLLIGKIISQRADSLNSLGFAILLMCFKNPFCVLNVGLKLSVFATFGIIIGAKAVKEPFKNDYKDTSKIRTTVNNFYNYLFEIVACTVFACVFTLPTTIINFGRISILMIPANMFLGFPATVCMLSSGLLALADNLKFLYFLVPIFKFTAGKSADFILNMSQALGSFKYGYIKADSKVFYRFFIVSLIVIILSILIKSFKENFSYKIPIVFCTIMVSAFCIFSFFDEINKVTITVCDVGNGSSIVVNNKRETALIGCGGDNYNGYYDLQKEINLSGDKNIKLICLPRSSWSESRYIYRILESNRADYLIVSKENKTLNERFKNLKYIVNSFYDIKLWKNVALKCYTSYDESYAILNIDNKKVLINFISDSFPKNENADILVCIKGIPDNVNSSNYDFIVLSSDSENAEYFEEKYKNTLSTGGRGNIRIEIYKNGKIKAERVS